MDTAGALMHFRNTWVLISNWCKTCKGNGKKINAGIDVCDELGQDPGVMNWQATANAASLA